MTRADRRANAIEQAQRPRSGPRDLPDDACLRANARATTVVLVAFPESACVRVHAPSLRRRAHDTDTDPGGGKHSRDPDTTHAATPRSVPPGRASVRLRSSRRARTRRRSRSQVGGVYESLIARSPDPLGAYPVIGSSEPALRHPPGLGRRDRQRVPGLRDLAGDEPPRAALDCELASSYWTRPLTITWVGLPFTLMPSKMLRSAFEWWTRAPRVPVVDES